MKSESLFSTGREHIPNFTCYLVVLARTKENVIKILGILAMVYYGFECWDSNILVNYY